DAAVGGDAVGGGVGGDADADAAGAVDDGYDVGRGVAVDVSALPGAPGGVGVLGAGVDGDADGEDRDDERAGDARDEVFRPVGGPRVVEPQCGGDTEDNGDEDSCDDPCPGRPVFEHRSADLS